MRPAFAIVLLFALIVGAPAQGQSLLEQIEREVSGIVQQARTSVVTIEDTGTEELPGVTTRAAAEKGKGSPPGEPDDAKKGIVQTRSATAARVGSGFVVEPGFVVTTADVLEGMSKPTVVTDKGLRYRASVVQIDHELNIGMLRLPSAAKVPPAKIGMSSAIHAGQFALAIGNQVGQPNAVAITLVSGLRTEGSFAGRRFYPALLQVAGSLGAGSSGAPILNSRGEVIGMLVAISASGSEEKGSGGYAIPIDDLRATVRLMANVKMYLRAWLGADLREEARVEQKADGVVDIIRTVAVEAVHPNSPALRSGLQRGDILQSLNGKPIGRMAEVRAAVIRLKPDQSLKLGVRRGARNQEVTVPFSPLPKQRD